MQHDHHVRSSGQCLPVARHLISAVSVIFGVDMRGNAEVACQANRSIGTEVIHQDSKVYDIRQFTDSCFQSFLGIIGGQHYCNNFSIQHNLGGSSPPRVSSHEQVTHGPF